MREIRRKKIGIDITIMILSCLGVVAAWYLGMPWKIVLTGLIAAVFIITFFLNDCMRQLGGNDALAFREQAATAFAIHELILLNEDEKPIRSWNLTDKTAVVIGRKDKEAEVDVDLDLSDCEYGALISHQHAVMNYCLDSWYIEDLGSQNGIQIKKVDDGKRYQVAASRPCKLSAGDVIYIAKTKLLFT